jgi:hypothetical protein
VDLYVGGTEHAVLHLLYARFWHKLLFDLGHVSTAEPFYKLVNQGLVLGEDGQKMSKSRGNVVNPDDILGEYGADAFRLYEMFMGPLEMVKPWSTKGVEGVYRFLGRVWRLFVDDASEQAFEQRLTTAPGPDVDAFGLLAEFGLGNDALGLELDVDEDVVTRDAHDAALDDAAFLVGADGARVLLEQRDALFLGEAGLGVERREILGASVKKFGGDGAGFGRHGNSGLERVGLRTPGEGCSWRVRTEVPADVRFAS